MNYIFYDLEATCWRDHRAKRQKETIEIGAVRVNEDLEIEDEFNAFIRPKMYPILSSFCRKLTSIRQEQIDRAKAFPYVVGDFRDWMGPSYLLCSWGYYDRRQLVLDCQLHGLNDGWLDEHVSVKHLHAKFNGLRQPMGLKNALLHEGLDFEGTPHRGIDDARNVARLVLHVPDMM